MEASVSISYSVPQCQVLKLRLDKCLTQSPGKPWLMISDYEPLLLNLLYEMMKSPSL